jgi:hypothetical protein
MSGLTIGSILGGVALTLLVLFVLARPFLQRRETEAELALDEVDVLRYRRDTLLRHIRELDDDLEGGKVAPELAARSRPALVMEAAQIMKQLDALGVGANSALGAPAPGVVTAAAAGPIAPDVDAEIEAAVRRLRTPEEIDDDIEAAVRALRSGAPAAAANGNGLRYCPGCGRRLDGSDRFCSGCGRDLKAEKAAATA